MANRLKEMGETASWRLMIRAALKGAEKYGYAMKRQPGRGLSNTWEASKDGETKIASIRTTRDRWIAFPPLDNGTRWKTLDDVELVIVSAVDDPENPQSVDVYLFPAKVVRQRFDKSYAARIENGHIVRDNFGMWVKLDAADTDLPTRAGAGLAVEYPAIAHYSIDELEAGMPDAAEPVAVEAPHEHHEVDEAPTFATVGDVLTWARSEIARLSGMSSDAIKLDLKIEA